MRSALNDSEKRLVVAQVVNLLICFCLVVLRRRRSQVSNLGQSKCFSRSFRPAQRQFHAPARLFMSSFTRRAFIESHGDLGAERRLYFHRNLGRQKTKAPVDM